MAPLLPPSSPLCYGASFLTSHHHQGHTVVEDASCAMPRNALCALTGIGGLDIAFALDVVALLAALT